MAALIRISLLLLIVFAGYKFYPQIKPLVQPALSNPKVLGEEISTPVINTINKVLPNNIVIPTIGTKTDVTNPTPESSTSSNLSNVTNAVIDQAKQKASEVAGNAVCQILLESLKKQCGIE